MNNNARLGTFCVMAVMKAGSELVTINYSEHVPIERDPKRIYDRDDELYQRSVAMQGWMDITSMRGRNQNKGKFIAELGYVSNATFGILETLGRGFVWGVVSNPLSAAIADCATQGSPEKKEEYEKISKLFKDSTALTFEATLQSGTSIFTNPFSHKLNLAAAEGVQGSIISESQPQHRW